MAARSCAGRVVLRGGRRGHDAPCDAVAGHRQGAGRPPPGHEACFAGLAARVRVRVRCCLSAVSRRCGPVVGSRAPLRGVGLRHSEEMVLALWHQLAVQETERGGPLSNGAAGLRWSACMPGCSIRGMMRQATWGFILSRCTRASCNCSGVASRPVRATMTACGGLMNPFEQLQR